jgi:serine/threonine-protein kinase HipA
LLQQNPKSKTLSDRCILVVERFDRRWTESGWLMRLPQEDCCQALSVPPSREYEAEGRPGISEIIDLLFGSDQPDEEASNVRSAKRDTRKRLKGTA